jgi:hypothetical protein
LSVLDGLVSHLKSFAVSGPEIRAEVWALGARHRGQVLEGARAEARAPGVSPKRAVLLAAVIRTYPAKRRADDRARADGHFEQDAP